MRDKSRAVRLRDRCHLTRRRRRLTFWCRFQRIFSHEACDDTIYRLLYIHMTFDNDSGWRSVRGAAPVGLSDVHICVLQDLLKHTPPSHPDHPLLQDALRISQNFLSSINEESTPRRQSTTVRKGEVSIDRCRAPPTSCACHLLGDWLFVGSLVVLVSG